MSYEVFNTPLVPFSSIVRLSDNVFIPMDNENIDYQEYLKWLDQGNTPEEKTNG